MMYNEINLKDVIDILENIEERDKYYYGSQYYLIHDDILISQLETLLERLKQ